MSRMLDALRQIEARSQQSRASAQFAPPVPPAPVLPPPTPAIEDGPGEEMLEAEGLREDERLHDDERLPSELPSPYGRGAGGEGSRPDHTIFSQDALTLTISRREREPLLPDADGPVDPRQTYLRVIHGDDASGAVESHVAALAGRQSPPLSLPRPVDTPSRPHPGMYERLAERISLQLPSGGRAVLMFTSPEDGAGQTQMLIPLAAALLDYVKGEILAVDANLRSPELADCCGIEAARGLSDVLLGVATWRELVRETTLPRVSLLPGVKVSSGEGPLPTDFDLGPLLKELAAEYPLLLIDAPSLAYAEAVALGRQCDGIYLVARLDHTARRALREAVNVIRESGGHLLGCIVIDS